MRILTTLTLLLAASTTWGANPAPVTGCPSNMKEYHQFDFWIGEWEVRTPQGAVAGHSRIEPVADGCGISEHWTGAKGSNGISYNAWEAEHKRWHQYWIDNSPGGTLDLFGEFEHGEMILTGLKANAQTGKPQMQRITWTPNADQSVRQHWQTSDDGGKSWADAFDGIYRKAKP